MTVMEKLLIIIMDSGYSEKEAKALLAQFLEEEAELFIEATKEKTE